MDIVHASLTRRPEAGDPAPAAEVGEVVDILWAHAGTAERLEHIGGRATPERLDLLFFFLPDTGTDTGTDTGVGTGADAEMDDCPVRRAAALLHRSHHESPLLQRRYLPPPLDQSATRP